MKKENGRKKGNLEGIKEERRKEAIKEVCGHAKYKLQCLH